MSVMNVRVWCQIIGLSSTNILHKLAGKLNYWYYINTGFDRNGNLRFQKVFLMFGYNNGRWLHRIIYLDKRYLIFILKLTTVKKYKTKIIFKTNINSCLICYRDIKIFDELFTFSLFLFVCFQFKGNSMFVVGIYFSIVIHL